MAENINFIEWDAKHRQYLIRLAGDEKSQEIRLAKMKAAEDMYEALKEEITHTAFNRLPRATKLCIIAALAKAKSK